MILLVIASLISCQALGDAILIKSSKSAIRIKRVVGGNFTDILMNPWLASIQLNGIHICGGSILSETIILTAAHCAYEYSPDKLSVRVGSSDSTVGGSKHDVMSVKIHEDYEKCREYTLNDLALLKLSSPLKFDGHVGKVSLARREYVIPPDTVASVAGWGDESFEDDANNKLKSTSVRIVDKTKCASDYKQDLIYWFKSLYTNYITRKQICATAPHTGPCWGDSGSPLMLDGSQVGLVSWSFGCANPKYPTVYTNVIFHRDWIDKFSQNFNADEEEEETQ